MHKHSGRRRRRLRCCRGRRRRFAEINWFRLFCNVNVFMPFQLHKWTLTAHKFHTPNDSESFFILQTTQNKSINRFFPKKFLTFVRSVASSDSIALIGWWLLMNYAKSKMTQYASHTEIFFGQNFNSQFFSVFCFVFFHSFLLSRIKNVLCVQFVASAQHFCRSLKCKRVACDCMGFRIYTKRHSTHAIWERNRKEKSDTNFCIIFPSLCSSFERILTVVPHTQRQTHTLAALHNSIRFENHNIVFVFGMFAMKLGLCEPNEYNQLLATTVNCPTHTLKWHVLDDILWTDPMARTNCTHHEFTQNRRIFSKNRITIHWKQRMKWSNISVMCCGSTVNGVAKANVRRQCLWTQSRQPDVRHNYWQSVTTVGWSFDELVNEFWQCVCVCVCSMHSFVGLSANATYELYIYAQQ